MNLAPQHYVPILKIKRGEKSALRELSPAIQSRVTPLLEIVERTTKGVGEHITTAFRDLADSVRPFSRCFIDAREMASDGAEAAVQVFERAAGSGIVFTPVTGISRTVDVAAAMEHRNHGIALRLRRDEFEAGGLSAGIQRFMDEHGLAPEGIDLIVDLGAVDNFVTVGVEALATGFLGAVPGHLQWRTFTISACAFPRSMGGVGRSSHALVERADWLAWRDGQHAHRASVARLPIYSDGVIQHPLGVEGFDPRTMQVSASVRYTAGDNWLLIKGVSTRRSVPSIQFPLLAAQLVYGGLRSHSYGEDHCAGCRAVKHVADGGAGYGSADKWRQVGTIHHITTVVEQLAGLPWP